MSLPPSNIKIIHWEYNEDILPKANNPTAQFKAGLTRDNDTGRPTGVYFTWKYLLEFQNKIGIHCLAQESFGFNNCKDVREDDLLTLMKISIYNFKGVFLERLDHLGIEVAPPYYPIHPGMFRELIDDLHQ